MPAQGECFVESKPCEPGTEFSRRLVTIEVGERTEIGGARRFLRELVIAQNTARNPVQPAVVTAHESLEGACIPPAGPFDQQQIRQLAKIGHRARSRCAHGGWMGNRIYDALRLKPG